MNESWMLARNGKDGGMVTTMDDDFYDDDDDIARTPPPSSADNILEEQTEHKRQMLDVSVSNNITISQMQDEVSCFNQSIHNTSHPVDSLIKIRKMKDEKMEQIGQIEYLKFKVQNSDKELSQLKCQIFEMQKSYEQKLNDERRRHERVEEDLRSELTYQEQELSSKQFHERLNSSAITTPSDDLHQQQSQVVAAGSNSNNASAEPSSTNTPVMLQTKKVAWNARRSGPKFPRTLNDTPNLALLFSHRKRPYGETQATFQAAPSPMKDPYQRPDFFYDIKRKRPTAADAETSSNWESNDEGRNCIDGVRRESVTRQAIERIDTETQTSIENHYDVSVCVNDKVNEDRLNRIAIASLNELNVVFSNIHYSGSNRTLGVVLSCTLSLMTFTRFYFHFPVHSTNDIQSSFRQLKCR